jgi:NADP-dependent 3-hydroxy acid dehydrogenase YdfG
MSNDSSKTAFFGGASRGISAAVARRIAKDALRVLVIF